MTTDKEVAKWFADRIDESHSGRLIIKTHVLNKFRKFSGDYETGNAVIKSKIAVFCNNNGFAV